MLNGALSRERSIWLAYTLLPIVEHGFALHKSAFEDAVSLWYGCYKIHHHTVLVLNEGVGHYSFLVLAME